MCARISVCACVCVCVSLSLCVCVRACVKFDLSFVHFFELVDKQINLSPTDVFIIERDSGVVRLQRPLSVLAQSQYTLTLAVTDGIYNSTVSTK